LGKRLDVEFIKICVVAKVEAQLKMIFALNMISSFDSLSITLTPVALCVFSS